MFRLGSPWDDFSRDGIPDFRTASPRVRPFASTYALKAFLDRWQGTGATTLLAVSDRHEQKGNVMKKRVLHNIAIVVGALVISSVSIVGDALANGVDCSNLPCTADNHITQDRSAMRVHGNRTAEHHSNSHYRYVR
jgi:hypothetical protein